jgi:hypothetical protein
MAILCTYKHHTVYNIGFQSLAVLGAEAILLREQFRCSLHGKCVTQVTGAVMWVTLSKVNDTLGKQWEWGVVQQGIPSG